MSSRSPRRTDESDWRFVTNHGVVLLTIAHNPDVRIHQLAGTVGISERACQKIVNDLRDAGYVTGRRIGRRNVYSVDRTLPLRHPALRALQVTRLLRLREAGDEAMGSDATADEAMDEPDLDPLVVNDWRRRVATVYARLRDGADARAAWHAWRAARDELFASHPATPLPREARRTFRGLPYHEYDPAFRVEATVMRGDGAELELGMSDGRTQRAVRFGRAEFRLRGEEHQLGVFWLLEYGGGVFLPFADATSGRSTYGAGRYLLDTVKGADLGEVDGKLVLDFNFAYNPSCSYDARWSCPLAPAGNRLDVAVEAGERYVATPS